MIGDGPLEITPDRFWAVFVNENGERLILHQERGWREPVLFHSDLGEEPRPIESLTTRQPAVGWVASGVILSSEEASWLAVSMLAAFRWCYK